MITDRKEKFITLLPKAKTPTDAARKAGYAHPAKQAYKLMHSKDIQDRIQYLGEIGLEALEEVAKNGKVEIAKVQAGKTLVETAYGKPKDNPTNRFGDVTINVNKVDDVSKLMESSVKQHQSLKQVDSTSVDEPTMDELRDAYSKYHSTKPHVAH